MDETPESPLDGTLGGYFKVHTRPPAFDGVDGQPYSVSIEVERVASLTNPYVGYLVYPRWAETGVGIVGHVETPILWERSSKEQVLEEAAALPLGEVKRLLDESIRRREHAADAGAPHAGAPHASVASDDSREGSRGRNAAESDSDAELEGDARPDSTVGTAGSSRSTEPDPSNP